MTLQVKELPDKIDYDTTLEIMSNDVSYFTHGFFKYPCKFIPQIPRWAILKYSKHNDLILDPFAGSGTTLVEAVLNKRDGLAVDFDKLSQLLCRTKTSKLTKRQVNKLIEYRSSLIDFENNYPISAQLPDLHNVRHWFSQQNIDDLLKLKTNIENLHRETKDDVINDFLLVCFASVIRKSSFADDTSPKPYVSRRIKKTPLSVKSVFVKSFDNYISSVRDYTDKIVGKSKLIAEDARDINTPKYFNKVALAITSPPYINAFDYVRSLRLENAWLGYYGDTDIVNIKKRQIGTESISVKEYGLGAKLTGVKTLDKVIKEISKMDRKRAYVVYKYFIDMKKNFDEVHKLLKPSGHYIVVVGNSKIRGIEVPTKDIFIEIAKMSGYNVCNVFSYVIKNRYLRIPRAGRGGYIDSDWVIDLEK